MGPDRRADLPKIVRLKAVDGENGRLYRRRSSSAGRAWDGLPPWACCPSTAALGIAAALLEQCEKELKLPRIRLSVRRSNEPALALYQKVWLPNGRRLAQLLPQRRRCAGFGKKALTFTSKSVYTFITGVYLHNASRYPTVGVTYQKHASMTRAFLHPPA